ncbi:ribosomal protein L37 [Cordyceps militaris CM01]|uniref:Large ribosomal subunit protein mL54 n=1 Tax=Cordyceps militaris (strain CM01) TaxID=983644 RepID=G3JK17_CORMM|nr:ribosomal protein L37 [Cordyceps militaris CM01]EGX91354.1 ribosomal protein L37 [Cordyceps militaris CM01]
MFCTRCLRTAVVRRQFPIARRQFSVAPFLRSAEPTLSTPTTAAGEAAPQKPKPKSSCPEGTILTGLNFTKSGSDPVAKRDEEYPEWLWSCLDVTKKSAEGDEDAAGDEFSKSKKQRRLAAKRQKATEAEMLASGNLEALQPKIPLPQQSINIQGEENGTVADNLAAAEKRQELKLAMRKERKAKIKESNYLKSM